MEDVLLFSNSQEVFKVTNSATAGKYRLVCRTYDLLKENQYPHSDIIIMHFDKEMTRDGAFEYILKVKGRFGQETPILALIEEGTPQDILSILNVGVYDYLEKTDDLQKYKKKIDELSLWNWYLKYSAQKNSNSDE